MRFSIWPNLQEPVELILEVARHADTTGWDGVWVADHFMANADGVQPADAAVLEATALLGGLAIATSNVRLGPLVFGTTYRHPAVLANWAATVDHLSGGRLVLGVGAGWQENEHEHYGIHLPPVRERIDRFDEVCQVLRSLLDEPRTTFSGEWFTLADAVCEPKPVQAHLPLLIGGKGNRMLGLVARRADEWNMWSLPAELIERSTELDRRCERIGRDPKTIVRSTQALVYLSDDATKAKRLADAVAPRQVVAGSVEKLTDVVGQWRDAGVDEVIIPDWVLGKGARRLDAMDQILEGVVPHFR